MSKQRWGQWMPVILTGFWVWWGAGSVKAQPIDPENRPVAEIRIEGLVKVAEQLVRNHIRLSEGKPYHERIVSDDLVRLTHLNRFGAIEVKFEAKEDGSLIVTYVLEELPLITDVQVVGTKALSDQEVLAQAKLRAGDPVDQFLIDQAIANIKKLYETKGYFQAQIGVKRQVLDETGVLVFDIIREGPKRRIRSIRFEGNKAFTHKQLKSQIESDTYVFIFRKGELSRQRLDQDKARLRKFYHDRGYLDAEIGRQIKISPDNKEAVVVFLIDEGAQYTVDSVRIEGARVFPDAKIRETIVLKSGDIFSAQRQRKSRQAVLALYGKMGFLETTVQLYPLFGETEPKVDVLIQINEGKPFIVGRVSVRGNQLTKDKVVLQQVRGMEPGRRFDRSGIAVTERRLRESALFSEAKVTIGGDKDDDVRDVIVEVGEKSTGSLSFGAGVSSDGGVIGQINLVQRNTDIADIPDSFGELITGKAFRGAGQFFSLTLGPGSDRSAYRVSFREPYLFDRDFLLDTDLFLVQSSLHNTYDEDHVGGKIGLGRRFGDVWSARGAARIEQVDINDIDDDAPSAIFAVEGDNLVTSLQISATRNTTDSRMFPTEGSVMKVGTEFVGALGGDFDFTKLTSRFRSFWTVDEDFFGRRTVLSSRVEIGYIFDRSDSPPVFEKFYAGGHRTFRGFERFGVGPREKDEEIGGNWLMLAGLEYNMPLYQDMVRLVVFTDTGTVSSPVSVAQYRVSVGAGLRIRLPLAAFAQTPAFALDFAVPLIKEDDDQTQVVSFDFALPF